MRKSSVSVSAKENGNSRDAEGKGLSQSKLVMFSIVFFLCVCVLGE